MIEVVSRDQCSGCKACGDVCPVNAISFITEQGFWYPKVNDEICVKCKACVKVCPALHMVKKEVGSCGVYACYSLDDEKRRLSTSGGLFSELALAAIDEGDAISGACYGKDNLIFHTLCKRPEDIKIIRQSKYAQSDTEGIYKVICGELRAGKPVVFSGTPCQNHALRNYIRLKCPDKENFITQIDFICRGIMSPQVYRAYLSSLEEKYGAHVALIRFKDVSKGWHNFGTKVYFSNGKTYYRDHKHDLYMFDYLFCNVGIRPVCEKCPYKGNFHSSDIIMADFWGIEKVAPDMDQDTGTSLAIINTSKGEKLFLQASSHMCVKKVRMEDVPGGNACLYSSIELGKQNQWFWNNLDKLGFTKVSHVMMRRQKRENVINRMKKIVAELTRRK